MIAMTVVLMVVGTMAALARTAQQGFEYCDGYGAATQHARIVLDRIAEAVSQATANRNFPGCIVVAEYENSCRYPDTLVVWRPVGTPAEPDGLPHYNELAVYCPDPQEPNQFVELRAPTNGGQVPETGNEAGWHEAIAALKQNPDSKTVVLTDLLRTCPLSTGNKKRGAARFELRLSPTDDELSGPAAWTDLPWPQDIFRLRQAWVRMELQLAPPSEGRGATGSPADPVAFIGSAARYYQLPQQ